MTKADLVTEIEAYAAAKATGNAALTARQGAVLNSLLERLPDNLGIAPTGNAQAEGAD